MDTYNSNENDYCEFTYTLHINITTIKLNIIEYCITLNYA